MINYILNELNNEDIFPRANVCYFQITKRDETIVYFYDILMFWSTYLFLATVQRFRMSVIILLITYNLNYSFSSFIVYIYFVDFFIIIYTL